MKHIFVVMLFCLLGVGQVQSQVYNVKKGLALDGHDPISYFDRKPTEGKPNFKYVYKGATYQFITAANMAKFKTSPEKYETAYGGWCAYAMGEKADKVKIDPETYEITNGKLYLFYNFRGTNTLTGWNKNEKKLNANADINWKKIEK